MIVAVLIGIGIILSVIFHLIGVQVGAVRLVWIVTVLMWAFVISFLSGEITPKGYEAVEKMRGHDSDTDALIKEALPKISVYELLMIKKSLTKHEKHQK